MPVPGPARRSRKSAKQFVWIAFGLWTGFTFVGYFTPIRDLAPGGAHARGPWEWFWILFYGFATYGNAGFMREQVCKHMCPYARFQSAMFDHDTMIISYDAARASRAARGRSRWARRAEGRGQGRVHRLHLCVQVCPTGIDIRKGLQYECIGCAACIDVCDGVMDKMDHPRGLIRYATQRHRAALDPSRCSGDARPRVRHDLHHAIMVWSIAACGQPALRTPVPRRRGATAVNAGAAGRRRHGRERLPAAADERAESRSVSASRSTGCRARSPRRKEVRSGPTQARWVVVAVQLQPETAAAWPRTRYRFTITRLAMRRAARSRCARSRPRRAALNRKDMAHA